MRSCREADHLDLPYQQTSFRAWHFLPGPEAWLHVYDLNGTKAVKKIKKHSTPQINQNHLNVTHNTHNTHHATLIYITVTRISSFQAVHQVDALFMRANAVLKGSAECSAICHL